MRTYAETEDTPRRRQTLQTDQGRKVPAEQGVQTAHPGQQDHEAKTPPAGNNGSRRGGCRKAREDAALQMSSATSPPPRRDGAKHGVRPCRGRAFRYFWCKESKRCLG